MLIVETRETGYRPVHPQRSRYDAIIVGARAAGAATAMLLARHGLDVLVVDRSRYGADTLSTHALMRGGVLQLHRWGLLERVVDAGTPPIRNTTLIYGTDRVDVAVKPAYGVDALYAPRRTVLDPIIVDAAAASGAELCYGVTVTDVQRDRQGRVTGIVGRDEDGRALRGRRGHRRRCGRSSLHHRPPGRRSHRANRHRCHRRRLWLLVRARHRRLRVDLPTQRHRRDHPHQRRPGLRLRRRHTGADRRRSARCPFTGSSPRPPPTSPPGSRPRPCPPGVRSFPGRPGVVRRSWGAGWALVGDAGYWKDPLSAHGLTNALRDAELLARAITSSSGEGSAGALANYQATRDALSAPLFDIADTIATQGWSDEEIPGLLLQLSAAMAEEVDELPALDTAPRPDLDPFAARRRSALTRRRRNPYRSAAALRTLRVRGTQPDGGVMSTSKRGQRRLRRWALVGVAALGLSASPIAKGGGGAVAAGVRQPHQQHVPEAARMRSVSHGVRYCIKRRYRPLPTPTAATAPQGCPVTRGASITWSTRSRPPGGR